MRYFKKMRRAFTMVELIFAMVVLGIVSSMGADMIANIYKSYLLQRAEHSSSIKAEIASLQIANRLRYAIPGTVFRIKSDGTLESVNTPLTGASSDYIGLQWVAYDGDSFETADTPGWSGLCDVSVSTKDKMVVKGSDLDLADTIIDKLSNGTKGIDDTVVYFPSGTHEYNVSKSADDNLSFDTASDMVEEHYKLAWSSYALIVEGGDLNLYYNFAPQPGAPRGNTKSLLLQGVTTFKFKGAGGVIRFKICKSENIGDTDKNITSCKEKAVF